MDSLIIVAAALFPIVTICYVGMAWLALKNIKEKRKIAIKGEHVYREVQSYRELVRNLTHQAESINNANEALKWVRNIQAVLR